MDAFTLARKTKEAKKMALRHIFNLKRLNNSVNGNPRYRVYFTDGSIAVTSSDAAFCYGIENKEMRGELEVTFTRAGLIADMSPTGN
jgi:hypothetical protein